jgi:hypothetical protein
MSLKRILISYLPIKFESINISMKNKFLIILMAFSSLLFSQEIVIKSLKLDSMIFNEINNYRRSFGSPIVKKMDNDKLKKRSYRLTELNSKWETDFDHTRGDSVFVGYNTECIHQQISTGSKFNSADLNDEAILKELAKNTVNAWIASNDHNYLIRSKFVDYSTITSIMRSDKTRFKLTVSYHDVLIGMNKIKISK